jgi:hypothetical protein
MCVSDCFTMCFWRYGVLLTATRGRLEVSEGDHQRQGVNRGGIETEGDVESSCILGNGVDNHSPSRDAIGGLDYPEGCVAEHAPPWSAALISTIHSQSRQNNYWNRLWQVPSESAGDIGLRDRARSERVVGDDTFVFTNHICSGCAARLIG